MTADELKTLVGRVWRSDAGNDWELVAVLDADRVRVKHVPEGHTHVWNKWSLVNAAGMTLTDDKPANKQGATMFDTINAATGFANGAEFDDAREVRAYFTPEAQREMFGAEAVTDARTLDAWADLVILNRWHMTR